jgi:hypothetical protein
VLILSYQKAEKRQKREKYPFFAASYMIMKNKMVGGERQRGRTEPVWIVLRLYIAFISGRGFLSRAL